MILSKQGLNRDAAFNLASKLNTQGHNYPWRNTWIMYETCNPLINGGSMTFEPGFMLHFDSRGVVNAIITRQSIP